MLLQLVIYGFHQFEEHSYDYYGRTNAFIHFLNHEVLGLPYSMQCNEYYLTQRNVYIINVIFIWIMIPVSIILSISYPTKLFNYISVGTIFVNGMAHCLVGIIKWSYNPGLITSITLFLPFCCYMFHRMMQSGLMIKTDIGFAVFQGILCHVPLQMIIFIVSQGWMVYEEQAIAVYFLSLFVIYTIYFVMFSLTDRQLLTKKSS